ncbi:glyoxylate carboligase [Streptomyces griseus]|uniref:Glyoxylate carboligase n=1 Tax=Streptomyces griseus subsp. griseus (strain JCM 4626 / CBS 651.72 / NBRC 13350 / KCC S-0626 / ISP 5235) TaxID=455632 RepID=B1VVH4_STRGG|nr:MULTISPECIES: glyoxylate carboligase [Streptomyces]MYR49000.1 glyoxylate carboligase [Streptomyces sp. SID4928]EGE40938.1 glyoxylate carboligase [Streptomyces sp. ACT-1]MBW3703803.1 glyoxylate carboligase [Streptomyces griseus]NEB57187.1 glyoxylate carboligase [Streptomyces griseus]SED56337.1 tartronate-semialdehyde synthase [Streptomyces griseus]
MPRMTAARAAVEILKREGVSNAFGVPGAAINPFYAALKASGGVQHTLARHVEGASHMAEGYTRAKAGNIGVCIGTSGPAGTDMITGLYSAIADSIPILCITGQAPTAVLHKEDFQAVDIASIAKPVTKAATTVLEAAQVPGVFQQAFHLMRTGRPGPVLIDLPIDVQLTEIEFDPELYEPLPVHKPAASRKQIERALELLNASERPLLVAGGGIINADASELLVEFAELTGVPVVPTLMGWGILPDDHELNAGMVGLQTSHRYGNANFLESDFVLGIGNRWANRHTGKLDVYTRGRTFVHVDIEPTQLGKIFAPDLGIASDAKAALTLFVEVARELKAAGRLKDRSAWAASTQERRATLQRKTHFDNVPLKPQRVYEEMNRAFGPETRYVTTIGLSQIAGAQMLHVYKPRHWINCGQAGPLGWTIPAALGVATADPEGTVVALSGDYDFQFMLEELAVGAQHRIPYVHVLVNNSYLGLIRQAQRNFDIDFQVNLEFENLNSPELGVYGVDHVKVVEGLGCKAIRVTEPDQLLPAFEEAKKLAAEFRVPVVVEAILERVTNIAMSGSDIASVNEFEDIATDASHAPTAIRPLAAS